MILESLSENIQCGDLSYLEIAEGRAFYLYLLFFRIGINMKTEYADGVIKRTIGLMFRKDFKGQMEFRFKKPSTIVVHTFFMCFPIDVIFYDEHDRIIKEVKNVKPWRIAYAKDVMRFVERKSR